MKTDDGQQDVGAMERQVKELERRIAETKSAQAGSDRRVSELSAENEELRKKVESFTSGEAPEIRSLQEKASALELKERAFNYSLEKGIDPKVAFELLGIDGAGIEDKIDRIGEYTKGVQYAERDKYLKKHGRTVHKTSLPNLPGSYAELNQASDQQLKAMGGAVDYITDQELKAQKPTLRNRLMKGGN